MERPRSPTIDNLTVENPTVKKMTPLNGSRLKR